MLTDDDKQYFNINIMANLETFLLSGDKRFLDRALTNGELFLMDYEKREDPVLE